MNMRSHRCIPRRWMGCTLLLLLGLHASAQMDTLTTRYRNPTFPYAPEGKGPNPVMLGPGSGMDSVRWYGGMINDWGRNWYEDRAHYRSTIGAPVAFQPSDTYLGQVITPPDNRDPAVAPTYESLDANGDVVWLDYAGELIASSSGVISVTWTLLGGATETVVYTISPQPDKRPVRIYWTHQRPATADEPLTVLPLQNAGPTVHFSNNYRVDIFGNSRVAAFDPATYDPLYEQGYVRLNGTELQAFEGTRGNFLLVYSRFDEITSKREKLAHEIVDVLEPMSTKLGVDIGGQLKPFTRPFNTADLFPIVTRGMVDETGNNEIYVYQHLSGPQRNWLWAIRNTVGNPWKIEVYWRAKEELDVLWPFELAIYEAGWNRDTAQLLARDPVNPGGSAAEDDPKVFFPMTMTVDAMPYQVPPNHLRVAGGALYSNYGTRQPPASTDGFALARYTSGELVWFETIRSVSRENEAFFPPAEQQATIPEALRPHEVAPDEFVFPGWVRTRNMPADPVRNPYNIHAYGYPTSYTPTNQLHSVVFPVNAGLLDVWWASASRFNEPPAPSAGYVAALPAPVYFPSQPTLYRSAYPRPGSTADALPAQIVLASGRGSTGGSINDFDSVVGPDFQAAPSSDRSVVLDGGSPSEDWAFEIWLKLGAPEEAGPFEFVRFDRPQPSGPPQLLFSVGFESGALKLGTQNVTPYCDFNSDFPPYARIGTEHERWHHFAVSFEDGVGTYYVNGHRAATFEATLPAVEFQGDQLTLLAGYDGSAHQFRLWSRARTWPELYTARYRPVAKPDSGLIVEYRIEPEWNPVTEAYVFFKPVLSDTSGNGNHLPLSAGDDLSMQRQGAFPRRQPGWLATGGSPSLYVQRDREADGFNPNEEHALLIGGVAHALRYDLNVTDESIPTTYSSEPFVLVQYTDADTGRHRMKALQVLPESDMDRFQRFIEAGQMIQSPDPLARLQPANWHDFIEGPVLPALGTAFRDRKDWFWAHQAGDDGGPARYVFDFWYPHQESFDYPDGNQPEIGTKTGWLAWYEGRGEDWPGRNEDSDPLGSPINFAFHALWPRDVPSLYVGDTLTTEKNNLPAIRGQLSVAVLYQQSEHHPAQDGLALRPSVHLIDPTRSRRVALPERPGALKSYLDPRTALYFFNELPPLLRDRLYWSPTAPFDQELQLIGQFRERTAHSYLLLNLLDPRSKAGATNPAIVTGGDDPDWVSALDLLPPGGDVVYLSDDAEPFDSLALATDGRGAGYVTLAFNDSENRDLVDPSESIFLHVIRVEPTLYQGELDPIYSSNPLDRQMNLKYTADFGGQLDRWAFQWQYGGPDNGRPPLPDDPAAWLELLDGDGLPFDDFATIGDAGVFGLSDWYVRCRYKALDEDVKALVGEGWSSWTRPQLAEGWIKRVLKAVNPFEQRIRDYMNVELNTELSMLQQAGRPYSGDIPLNQEALNDYGLIPIYETLLRQARKLSIDAEFEALGALSLALQMAAGRLSELYIVLGNEALADALNPTIDLGTQSPVDDFVESSIFCFQNQKRTLLDEELALLRGRDLADEYLLAENHPIEPWHFPVYNRLIWNFTHDIMGGQVAYVLNYGITDLKGNNDGSLDVEDAQALYPQGHGDAYGHYLSAIKHYYFLLRHPNFGWLPQAEGILAGDTEITISYFHEKRFAMAALAKARTAELIVSRTHRQQYRFGATDAWAIAEDDVPGRHWGVDEWATRGHLGAYFDWLTVNALLPSRETQERGIRMIDREGTPELGELGDIARRIQRNADKADSGLNPLGLADHAVPFDISPAALDNGQTHFEQIFVRARRALRNAAEAFDRIKHVSNALRDQNEARDFDTMVADEEAAITRRLIEVYGYPYADDIGPGQNYPQGYQGPDLLNYTYIDLYDLDDSLAIGGRYFTVTLDQYLPQNERIVGTFQAEVDTSLIDLGSEGSVQPGTVVFEMDDLESDDDVLRQWVDLETTGLPVVVVDSGTSLLDGEVTYTFNVVGWTNEPYSVRYYVAPNGFPGKPPEYTGQRRAEGEIQMALAEYGVQLFALRESIESASAAATEVRTRFDTLRAYDYQTMIELPITVAYQEVRDYYNAAIQKAQELSEGIDRVAKVRDLVTNAGVESFPRVAGLANDITSPARGALIGLRAGLQETLNLQQADYAAIIAELEVNLSEIDGLVEAALTFSVNNTERRRMLSSILEASRSAKAGVARLNSALNIANGARMRVAALESEGQQLQVERERLRLQWSSDLNTRRYRNMMYQILRNDELQRYNETFETAARYVFLAARAYDYETGLLATDASHTAGSDFMTQIVRARALGRFSRQNGAPSEPMGGGAIGDPGLADVLFRMGENWEVLRGRLGFNNPQHELDAFSLRTECFRKVHDPSGDVAWRDILQAHWRENLLEMPEFRRYCLPFDPMNAVEPGFAIPFSTTVSFRSNYFGQDLEGGDNAFESSYFATKLRGVGIWFQGYSSAPVTGLANRPQVYLIPAGVDTMRVPIQSSGSSAAYRSWQVVDHALPLPYPLADSQWESPDWSALQNLLGNELWTIRRHPSMRAFHDSGYHPDQMSYNARLVGRSVWNSQWWLIIPAGSLHSDDETARQRFLDHVTDIKLYLKTYSFSGN